MMKEGDCFVARSSLLAITLIYYENHYQINNKMNNKALDVIIESFIYYD